MTERRRLVHTVFLFLLPIVVAAWDWSVWTAILVVLLMLAWRWLIVLSGYVRPEKHPDLRAFNLSTFGMVEASESKGHHPGDGLSFLKDVTELLVRLTITGDWDGRSLRVSFVPAPWGDYPISVQVGRVSLMLE